MLVAISVWNQRIAPVFDVSRMALLCLTQHGRMIREYREGLPSADPVGKIHKLLSLKTDVLICGAISRNILELAEMHGIATFPFTTGSVEEVKTAYMQDRLAESGFARPGFRKRRRKRCQVAEQSFDHKNPFSEE
ncbi:MAG: NifB/NifX family molybdenum-iron cluster-binding protein [Desulfohalobiaceae bacterium]|nr:NifB/NifX family molybdenum-iron cluster-binding protein [Desulfohalobiaceae bacterium]